MTALVGSVFAAALLGSVHCAAMCGSFACLAGGGRHGAPGWRAAAAYHLGRLGSYLTLGGLAGLAGGGLDRAGAVAGLARPAASLAGLLLVVWGAASLASALGVRVPLLAVPPVLSRLIAAALRALPTDRPVRRALAIGALTAALPCGWLYAFVATAAATGDARTGAATMVAFWAGTVPLLASVGVGAQLALGPLRRHLPVLTAVVVILLGGLTVAGRFSPVPPAIAVAAPASSVGAPSSFAVPSFPSTHDHRTRP